MDSVMFIGWQMAPVLVILAYLVVNSKHCNFRMQWSEVDWGNRFIMGDQWGTTDQLGYVLWTYVAWYCKSCSPTPITQWGWQSCTLVSVMKSKPVVPHRFAKLLYVLDKILSELKFFSIIMKSCSKHSITHLMRTTLQATGLVHSLTFLHHRGG